VDTIPHDDWVSVITSLRTGPVDNNEYVFTGSFDGIARLIKFPTAKKGEGSSGAGEVLLKTHPLGSSITAIAAWKETANPVTNEVSRYLISCQDETLRLYTVSKADDKLRVDLKTRFKGHEDTINAIDVNSKQTMACTASDDKTVRIWDLTRTSGDAVEEQPNKKKKRRVDVSEGSQIAQLEGHILGVTCLKYSPQGDSLFSGGMDHTIRIHDLTTGSISGTIHGAKPPTALAPHPQYTETPLILCSYPDNMIRLHDSRTSSKATLFKSHKAWVRGVQWFTRPNADNSEGSYSFLSWADDNHLKIWDMRSSVPVHSFKHSDKEQDKTISDWKVLAAHTLPDSILSGGSDCMLRKHLI
jgi:WD40 repeat protein